MKIVNWLFVVSAALFISGIGFIIAGARTSDAAPAVAAAPPMTAVASVKQIMDGIVGPSAKTVYDAVGTRVTMAGVEDFAPKNDAEWAAVGNSAAAIAEAANLLLVEQRLVDRGDWVTMSKAMADAAALAMKAAADKSTEGILDAGGPLNDTCDACHARYQRQ